MFEEAWFELRYVNIVLSMIVNSREYRDEEAKAACYLNDIS